MRGRAQLALLAVLGLAAGAWGVHRLGREEPAAPVRLDEPAAVSQALFAERRPVAPAASAAPAPDPLAEAVRRNNEAAQRIEAGEYEPAIRILEELVGEHPEHAPFRSNLSEALVRQGVQRQLERETEAAIASVERALVIDPDRPDREDLQELGRRWRAETDLATDHWTEDSDLFELSYSVERDDILHHSQAVLDHLGRAYEDLRLWFGRDPVRREGRNRIRVVLYRQEEFHRVTGLGDWAGGAFDGVVRVAVEDLRADPDRWQRILRHELVHVFVLELGGPGVPGWLNEGLSQLLEADPPPLAAARERVAGKEPFPLERLRGSLASWRDAPKIERAYAQSLLLVERIAREYGPEPLRRMVCGCASGVPPARSFEAYTSVPLDFVVDLLARR